MDDLSEALTECGNRREKRFTIASEVKVIAF